NSCIRSLFVLRQFPPKLSFRRRLNGQEGRLTESAVGGAGRRVSGTAAQCRLEAGRGDGDDRTVEAQTDELRRSDRGGIGGEAVQPFAQRLVLRRKLFVLTGELLAQSVQTAGGLGER